MKENGKLDSRYFLEEKLREEDEEETNKNAVRILCPP